MQALLRKSVPAFAVLATLAASPVCAMTTDPTAPPAPIVMQILILYVGLYSAVMGLVH